MRMKKLGALANNADNGSLVVSGATGDRILELILDQRVLNDDTWHANIDSDATDPFGSWVNGAPMTSLAGRQQAAQLQQQHEHQEQADQLQKQQHHEAEELQQHHHHQQEEQPKKHKHKHTHKHKQPEMPKSHSAFQAKSAPDNT